MKRPAPDLERFVQNWEEAAPAEEVKPYYRVWTQLGVLDSVYVAREIDRNLGDVKELSVRRDIKDTYFTTGGLTKRPAPGLALSPSYLTPNGAFRIHERDHSSLYAIDAGVRLAASYAIGGRTSLEHNRDFDRWSAALSSSSVVIRDLVRSYADEAAFPATGDGAPSLFGTFAATSAVSRYLELQSVWPLPSIDFPAREVARGLLRESFLFEDERHFAFRRSNSSFAGGCLSSSWYAFRIGDMLASARLLGPANDELLAIRRYADGKATKALRFVLDCWDARSGGFKAHTTDAAIPNLGHTRYALQLLRALYENFGAKLPRDSISVEMLAQILSFVLSCRVSIAGYDGFDNVPKGVYPTVCSQRSAVNVVKLSELLVRMLDLTPDRNYLRLRDELVRLVQGSARLVSACIDERLGVCYAGPIEPLKSAKWRDVLGERPSPTNGVTADSTPVLMEPREPSPNAVASRQWIKSHRAELARRFAGHWIVVVAGDTEVVGYGKTPGDAVRMAFKHHRGSLVSEFVPDDSASRPMATI